MLQDCVVRSDELRFRTRRRDENDVQVSGVWWVKLTLISTNSVNSILESTLKVLVVYVLALSGSVSRGKLEFTVVSRIAGTFVQPSASSTAASASTTPKPYSWLK